MSTEPIRQDQDDFGALIDADPYFADIPVLVQRKGVTENDINVALSTLLEEGGKIGACVVVIMPELKPDDSQSPGARYFVRIAIQAIVQPLLADDPTSGVGKNAEEIAERIRQICHLRNFGRSNTYSFDGMEPIPADAGKNSYGVYFRRLGGDNNISKVVRPVISASSLGVPSTITLTCATPGAAIYFTKDGSYPSAANADASLYSAPVEQAEAATIRAAAELAEYQQSDIAQLILT